MRQLQTNEVKAVSGAGLIGLLFNVGQTTGAVVKPVVTGTASTLKWILF